MRKPVVSAASAKAAAARRDEMAAWLVCLAVLLSTLTLVARISSVW
jgi:hypothetical protein